MPEFGISITFISEYIHRSLRSFTEAFLSFVCQALNNIGEILKVGFVLF